MRFNNSKRSKQIYKKKDAVRRCLKGYECNFIAKEKLKHLVSKDAFNVDGLGKKVIDQFWELKLIRKPSDIFTIDYNKIENLDGWGKLSINNLWFFCSSDESSCFIIAIKFNSPLGFTG